MSIWDEKGSGDINWKKNLIVLWIGIFLACASYTSCVPFLPVYLLKELHVDEANINFWSGIVYAITFLGSSIMAPYWGAWADKIGQRKMAIRAGIGLSLTYWLGAVVQSPEQFFGVRLITGLISGFVPASLALVSSSLPENKMGWGMGLMQTAIASGTIMGPLLGGYLSTWFGMRMSFFVGAASLLFATTMVFFLVRDGAHNKEVIVKKVSMLADLKEAYSNISLRYVMCIFFLIQVCTMLIQPLVTIYVGDLMGGNDNKSIEMAGWIFSIGGIAGILAAPFWGNQGQRFGFFKVLSIVFACAGIVNLFQPLIGNIWQFAIIQFVYGLFLAGAIPNVNSALVEVTDKSMRGKSFGLVTSAQQFGGVVGPVLGGIMGSMMSTKYVLFITGCVLICAAYYNYKTRVANKVIY